MRCDQCKYWEHWSDHDNFGGARACHAVKHHSSTMDPTYGQDGGAERRQALEAAAKAWVEDASGYNATLYTKAAFGCVLFEEGRMEVPKDDE
jgi:hypothetical protein